MWYPVCAFFLNDYQADDAWGNFLSNVGQLWAYVAINGQPGETQGPWPI